MDTREKIVPLTDLAGRLGSQNWLAVTGAFDPLTLPQAERLATLAAKGRPVLAVVDPAPHALLPAEARAVLLAALKSVALVVITEAGALPKLANVELLEDAALDQRFAQAFVEHVRSRQSAK